MNPPLDAFHQTSTRDRQSQAFTGQLAMAARLALLHTLINSAPQTAQVSTITVDSASDDTTYSITINGVDVSYTSGTGATTSTIATGLAAAVNAEPLVRAFVEAEASSADVVITALNAGRSFTISEDEADLSLASTTANDEADAVKVGRAVTSEGDDPSTDPDTDSELGHIAAAAKMTAQVWEFTGDSIASGDSIISTVHVEGVRYTVITAFDTNNDTTIANVASDLNGALPANSVIASAASGVLTLTSEVAGKTFDADVTPYGTGGGTVTRTTTDVSASDDLAYGFGVALRGYDEEQDADGEFSYPGLAGMRVLMQGKVWVEHNGGSSPPSAGDPVYVYVGSTTADQGKFYNAAGTDRIKLPRSLAVWKGRTDRDSDASLGLLEVRPRSI